MARVVNQDEVLAVEDAFVLHLDFVFDTLFSLFSKEDLYSVFRSILIFKYLNFVEFFNFSEFTNLSDLTGYWRQISATNLAGGADN